MKKKNDSVETTNAVYSEQQATGEGYSAPPQKPKKKKKMVFIIIAVVVVLIIIIAAASGGGGSDKSTTNEPSATTENTDASSTTEEPSTTTESADSEEASATAPSEEETATTTPPKEETSTADDKFKKSDYKDIEYEELARKPDKYKDEKVKFTGYVVQDPMEIEGGFQSVMSLDEEGYSIVYFEYIPSATDERILAGDTVTIYGVSAGIFSYGAADGSMKSVPSVGVVKIERDS